jgi:hypothetical protein
MQVLRNWRWNALTVLFIFSTQAARAGMITPDSIPNPPSAVSSVNGTPVSLSNVVISQYAGLGMNLNAPAITRLNGVPVWVPVNFPAGTGGSVIDYATSSVGGSFVFPGTSKALSPSSVSLDIIGNPGTPKFLVGGFNGMPLNIAPALQNTPGPDGGQIWNVSGAGIYSIYVSSSGTDSPWGVSEVSFKAASTPEPSTLVLAGLGALGLATRLRWRRSWRLA